VDGVEGGVVNYALFEEVFEFLKGGISGRVSGDNWVVVDGMNLQS
jgi:hypothetical protein